MSKRTKQIMFGVFGISCKAIFHLLAFIATYCYCRKVFTILLSIWIIHNIASLIAYKGKLIFSDR